MTPNPSSSRRTRVRRLPKRGVYDREAIDAILDEALVAHLGFVDDGHPVVIPTLCARHDQELLLHGSSASRALKLAGAGAEISVAVTQLDGLVLARSAFHHSVNYRSVVIFGRPRLIDDPEEKLRALELFVERFSSGRWAQVRHPTPQELKATTVLALPLVESSAKIRTGPPVDDAEDYGLGVWAGVIPLALSELEPTQDKSTEPPGA